MHVVVTYVHILNLLKSILYTNQYHSMVEKCLELVKGGVEGLKNTQGRARPRRYPAGAASGSMRDGVRAWRPGLSFSNVDLSNGDQNVQAV